MSWEAPERVSIKRTPLVIAVILILFRVWLPHEVACGLSPAQASGAAPADREKVQVELHDVELMDQNENRLKFRSEVIDDKVAVVIPFYTDCTTSYPILIFILTRLQDMLGDRLNRDVVLISVTVDPRTDNSVRLKAYAKQQKAKPGWFFLSGDRISLGQVLWGMGVLPSSNLEEHNHIPITMVGSVEGGWRKFHGFPSPDQLLAQVEKLLAAGGG
jgi:protein SCO1/2